MFYLCFDRLLGSWIINEFFNTVWNGVTGGTGGYGWQMSQWVVNDVRAVFQLSVKSKLLDNYFGLGFGFTTVWNWQSSLIGK